MSLESHGGPIVCISDHAYKRARERLGLNGRSFGRLARKAFADGIRHKQTKGALKRFIDRLHLRNRAVDNIRIYGEHVYLFQGIFLVTVYRVPTELIKYLKYFKQ
ncbi:hypothetical protein [Flavobacterium sp. Leaf359]|uniref:hypothetical protein n=1 Tax=Flavobacterium sp. Leaf359 TaxID=1736351 RepID=UPI0012FC6AF1|nr:hypothetical protein [Flavobacterium sp. Leaf359]